MKPQIWRWFAPASVLLTIGCATPHQHGSMSSMSIASDRGWKACEHDVPEEVCVQCHPELSQSFRDKGDWCPEHDVPESQCLECHPDLDFSPPEDPPEEADVVQLVKAGEDLPELEAHLVEGKFTVFDFHADWCPPCRKLDEHLFEQLETRKDIAVRKLNVVSWDSPLAKRWLSEVSELPYLIVFDGAGRRIGEVHGAKLDQLDELLGMGDE